MTKKYNFKLHISYNNYVIISLFSIKSSKGHMPKAGLLEYKKHEPTTTSTSQAIWTKIVSSDTHFGLNMFIGTGSARSSFNESRDPC